VHVSTATRGLAGIGQEVAHGGEETVSICVNFLRNDTLGVDFTKVAKCLELVIESDRKRALLFSKNQFIFS